MVGSVWKGMRGSSRVLIMVLTLSAGFPDVFILWKFTELYSYCWCISLYVIKIKKKLTKTRYPECRPKA